MKKLSVVVPYRNREEHLKEFIPAVETELKKQEIPFEIVIVEQNDNKPFNRAMLLNIGFEESKYCDYFAFHDVDMIPLDSDYSYPEGPTHLAARAEQFGWKLPYEGYFGGVTLFDKESFIKINGYSNEYWGWGAEDDDVLFRCNLMEVDTFRKDCRYKSLSHERDIKQSLYSDNLSKYGGLINTKNEIAKKKILMDGISMLNYGRDSEEKLSDHSRIIKVKL